MSLVVKCFTFNMAQENTYVVHDESGEAAIIDCGAFYPEEEQQIADYIAAQQLRVTHHLCTHGHFDHIFGSAFVLRTYGVAPQMHRDDESTYLASESLIRLLMRAEIRLDLPAVGHYLTAGEVVRVGNHSFEVRFTPGHSVGSVSFYTPEAKLVFGGDCLFQGGIGRTDLPGGDYHTLINSITTQLLTLPDDTIVYAGHGPATTIGYERNSNPYLC